MAVTINAKGTSYPSYTIGKKGVTIYQGSSDPGSVNEGDVWIDSNDGSIKTYTSSAFSPPKVGTLEMDGSTITPDDGTLAVTGSLDVTGTINGEKIASVSTQTTSASIANALVIPLANDKTITFELKGSALESATGDTFGFTLTGCIKNVAGETSMVGDTYSLEFKDVGASAWSIDGVANNTADDLEIKITGEATHTIDWDFVIKYIEV